MKRAAILIALTGLGTFCIGAAEAGSHMPEMRASAAQPQAGYRDIASRELREAMQGKDFFFVNVHVPYEGDIERTDTSIPFDKIHLHLDKLPKEKDAKIVLYCRTGFMSAIAARKLVSLGYTNVSHLKGGFIDWQKQGFPLAGR